MKEVAPVSGRFHRRADLIREVPARQTQITIPANPRDAPNATSTVVAIGTKTGLSRPHRRLNCVIIRNQIVARNVTPITAAVETKSARVRHPDARIRIRLPRVQQVLVLAVSSHKTATAPNVGKLTN